jgi:M6 family metalloprotease-like protein
MSPFARARTALTLAGLAAALAVPAAASADYPSPLPDFSAPPPGAGARLGPATGRIAARRLLVVHERFSDVASPAGADDATLAARAFGAYPSLADYFRTVSAGRIASFSAAAETCGTAGDGVVTVTTGTRAEYAARRETAQWNVAPLLTADACVNFAAFDADANGRLTPDELAILVVNDPYNAGDVGGATRAATVSGLDGKTWNDKVARADVTANTLTWQHETAHELFDVRDFYGFGVGALDLFGPTGSATDLQFMASAYLRTKLGWITPTVVTRDGYYDVPSAASSPTAFILYDYDTPDGLDGAADYFIVENRRRVAGTYDRNASDSGLVVWRIDEAVYGSASESLRPIEIMRPDGTRPNGCNETPGFCYPGSQVDAWDPGDARTPQREMTRTWRNGLDSDVAVRAIPPAAPTMRVYFDVRGPGVLVDPGPGTTALQAGAAGTVTVPVRNTGEATDSFSVALTGVPAGWSAPPATVTLPAGAGADVALSVTAPAGAAGYAGTLRARATSTGDARTTSDAPLALSVTAPPTDPGPGPGPGAAPVALTYLGPARAATGDTVALSAVLRRRADGSTVGGVPVTYTLSSAAARQQVTATTGGDGVASASLVLSVPPGAYTLTVGAGSTAATAADTLTIPVTIAAQERALSLLGLSPTRFTAKRGTTIRYRLARPAAVDLAVAQLVAGRRSGAKCVKPSRRLRRAKKCTRPVPVGSFSRSGPAGQVAIGFRGRVGKRRLEPGAYELTATPRGAPSDRMRARFRILTR